MYILQGTVLCITFSCVNLQLNFGILETAKNPFQYLEEQNYQYENHTVVTEDGYVLLLVRIPHNRHESSSGKTKPPLLFVHGILASFYDYLLTGPGIAFGFKALEKGYDVFLLNTRGNRWSRSHTTLDPDLNPTAFWNFSFHEVGLYDIPATIDYISNITGYSKVSYVGHSQGSTAFLAMASTRPDYNEKIKLAVLLAPAAYMDHAQFPMLILFKDNLDVVEEVVKVLDLNEILPYNHNFSEIAQALCSPYSLTIHMCRDFFYRMVGPSRQINDSIIYAYLANYPAGASAKQFLHFLQIANSETSFERHIHIPELMSEILGKFRLYDYKEANILQYGQITPPDYDLSAITSPVAMYYGATDYFVALADVLKLVSSLPNVVRPVLVPYSQINHLDILMGTKIVNLVTEPALDVLNTYNNL